MRRWVVIGAVVALGGAAALAALASGSPRGAGGGGGTLQVVAAENVWGSIAQQLGGSRVSVTSILVNPDTDPHDYQPRASDARAFAGARLAIVNGVGYDGWASKLLAANSGSGHVVVDVGDLLGLKTGDNPHQWYDPASVRTVIGAISAAYARLDPAHGAYFAAHRRHLESVSLRTYDRLRAEIRTRFAGVPIGYSESIFEPLGRDLGLKLLTPAGFAKAVSEGTEVTAGDRETVDRQARTRQIAVWVSNRQNETPDVQRVDAIARQRHIPVVTITETLSPASASFEQWQVAQLRRLLTALHRATGR